MHSLTQSLTTVIDLDVSLTKDGSISMNHKNLWKLVVKIFKVGNGSGPEIMNEIFQFQMLNHYNLRNNSTF